MSASFSKSLESGFARETRRAKRGEPLDFLKSHIGHQGSGCVLWPFSQSGTGYAYIKHGDVSKTASNVMCTLAHGKAPAGHEAAHDCGVRLCVNPNHLRWATAVDNHADKKAHGTSNCGERHGSAKLTEEQVREVLLGVNEGVFYRVYAAKFDVSLAAIAKIAKGRKWAYFAPEIPRQRARAA